MAASSTEWRLIARNTTSSYGVRILLALSALLVTPYLFRTLGVAGFGTWSVIFTIATIFGVVELGFSGGITKRIAECRAHGRRGELEDTLGAALSLMSGLGLGAFAIAIAIAFIGRDLASGNAEEAFFRGMVIVGAAMIVRFPCAAYAATLAGYQRYDLLNLARAAAVVAFPIGAVIAVESGAGVLGVTVAFTAALLVDALLYGLLLHMTDPLVSLRPRSGDRRKRRSLAGFSSYVFFAASMNFIATRMDTVVVAAIRGAAAAGSYAAALKLQSGLQSLTMPFVTLLMPMISDLWARARKDEVVRRFVLATRVVLQITLPVATGLALFAKDAIDLWLGEGAPAVTADIVVVLMVAQGIGLAAAPAEQALIGVGRVRLLAVFSFAEGLANLSLSIGLVFAYGAVGAALGTLLTSALLAPFKLGLTCRVLETSATELIRRGVLVAVASSLPAVIVMVVIRLLLPLGTERFLLGLGLGLLTAGAVGVAQVGPQRLVSSLRELLPRREETVAEARPF